MSGQVQAGRYIELPLLYCNVGTVVGSRMCETEFCIMTDCIAFLTAGTGWRSEMHTHPRDNEGNTQCPRLNYRLLQIFWSISNTRKGIPEQVDVHIGLSIIDSIQCTSGYFTGCPFTHQYTTMNRNSMTDPTNIDRRRSPLAYTRHIGEP